jgi:hypothetical protein
VLANRRSGFVVDATRAGPHSRRATRLAAELLERTEASR